MFFCSQTVLPFVAPLRTLGSCVLGSFTPSFTSVFSPDSSWFCTDLFFPFPTVYLHVKYKQIIWEWELLPFIDPATVYVLSIFMLSFIFVIVCGLFKWNLCRFFIIYLYNCHWRSNYQEGRIWISLTGFTLPHLCACPKKGLPTNIISFSRSMSQGDLLILLIITV